MLTSPNYAAKTWVTEQYDSQVMADTVAGPGGSAGVVRVHGTTKGLAFTSDVTPRYVRANPVEGGKQAVAEAYRNLTAMGALPLAATDNLNFGNPEKPEIMGQFVGAIQGIGEACAALDMPIVSGNVSLYNETDGQPILPTPTIGAVGLITRSGQTGSMVRRRQGCVAHHAGRQRGASGRLGHPVGGLWPRGRGRACDRSRGRAPPWRFHPRQCQLYRRLHADLSDGGLALAGFEMAAAAGVGLSLEAEDTPTLFGEDQGRYLIACSYDTAEWLMVEAAQAGLTLQTVGQFGGSDIRLGRFSAPLDELAEIWRGSFAEALA